MKKSIICSLVLIFAFSICAFSEENVVKSVSQKSSVAAKTVTTETKAAADAVKKDIATAEQKVAADANKVSTETKSAVDNAKKSVEAAEEKVVKEAKSTVDTVKKDVTTAEQKVAADADKISTEAKSAVNDAKTTVAIAEEKTVAEAESVANAAKKDVETAEEKVVKETKDAVDTVKKDVVAEENKVQTENKIKEEAPETVKETSEKTVAKNKDAEETSGTRKIFNYSKDKSRTEIEIKVGRTVNAKPEIAREPVDGDDVYTVGIEVVAYSNSFIGFGAGIYNVFDSKIKKDGVTKTDPRPEGNNGEYKIAFTNPYLTLKSKILQFDSDIIRNVYIFGQIGYGFMRIENAYETEDGMYWGVGGGIDIWHFLIDVNYATNFGKIKMNHGEKKMDVRQSTIIVSLGDRFSL